MTIRARRSSLRVTVALLLLVCAVPSGAQAAVEVSCLNAFATRAPTSWCAPGFSDVVTPKGQPFGATWVRETLFVRGVASAVDPLVVTVTDGVTTVEEPVQPQPADASQGRPMGGFSVAIPVFNLGVHAAEPGADPLINAGYSVLVVNVLTADTRAVVAAMKVEKKAATARDIYKPILGRIKWPPTTWCHTSVFGVCGATSNQSVTLLGVPLSRFPVPTGEAVVSGQVDDDPSSSYGLASEVADIAMTIRRGTTVIRGPFSVVNRTSGVTAAWNVVLKVEEFTPNYWPGWDKYYIDVRVTDAWGNAVQVTSPGFTVYDL